MSDGSEWVYGEAREWQQGRHKKTNRSVYAHGGELGHSRIRKGMTRIQAAYDRLARRDELPEEMPATFEDTQTAQQLRHIEGTETYSRAVLNGDAGTIRHMVGSPDAQADISGLHAIDTLESIVGRPAFMAYQWAEPGSGKTNFALLLAQLYKRAHPEAEIGTNIRSLKEKDFWIKSYGHLEEWMHGDAEAALEGNATPKLMIFDEASSHASGRGADGYETASKLGPMLYKIRKYGGSLIIIGHDGKDVHPAVRELATAIHKTGLQSATFFDTVENRKGKGEIMSIEGIPETDWRYNDKEPTNWSWTGGTQTEDDLEAEAEQIAQEIAASKTKTERREMAQRWRNQGYSYPEIASLLDVSQSTAHRWCNAES